MARALGNTVINGVEFKREERQTGLLGMNPNHIPEANRPHVALPGGGWLKWGWKKRWDPTITLSTGDCYAACLSPWSDHPDTTSPSRFDSSSPTSPTAGVTGSMSTDASDVLDRSYSWKVDRVIEETVRGDWAESDAPESVESPDGQAALEEFTGHLSPCSHEDIRSCECCRCPECNAIGIRGRKNKSPTYACGNPSCDADPFEQPALRPARQSEPTGD